MVFNKEREQGTLEIEGTLTDLLGPKGKIDISVNNLKNVDKALTLRVTNSKGQFATIYCSKPVSAGIRSKEISASQMLSLLVTPAVIKDKDGNDVNIYRLIRPQGETVTMDLSKLKAEELTPSKVDIADLIAGI